ncbi:MAG: acyl-CoA desaturase, partial [Merismopedia sp. SIO2A8]|nr:acyl-CoA desaturase [Merismopedia sp. SIO2A8]
IEGGPIFWVAGHRIHHLHTEDIVHDPYSAKRGFWWSHLLWMLYPRAEHFDYAFYKKYAPDLAKDRYYRWLDRYFLVLQLPLALMLYAWGGWSFVIYGLVVRVVALWHCTWLINSASHAFGYRTFDEVADNSRNLWWAGILAYGEGWHNNHHAYPNMAKAGLKWWEIDMTWWAIQGLRGLGLARNVVLPPKEVRDRL